MELIDIKEFNGKAKVIILDRYNDNRGYFFESYHQKRYEKAGIKDIFVQSNISFSKKNVIRGLHYQYPTLQSKLVSVIAGEILDVIVDIRLNSPSFGKFVSINLSCENKKQLFVPKGFAHGFSVLSETAIVHYKCSDFYSPSDEKGLLWNDESLKINWQVQNPIVSEKDKILPSLKDISKKDLPKIVLSDKC